MISLSDLSLLPGRTVHGRGGEKIGKVVDVYESTDGAAGTFVTVSTGLFGTGASFLPLAEASLDGDDVVVPYDKARVKDAPRVDTDEELSAQEEERLYQHYGLGGAVGGRQHAVDAVDGAEAADGAAASGGAAAFGRAGASDGGNAHDDDVHDRGGHEDGAMTRSEERLQVGTQRVESGRARLRKRIVTEVETRTVPVGHDEVHIERAPVSDGTVVGNPETALTEQAHEIVITRETPVVSKETVEVERVRIGTQAVTEQATVREQLRKEKIELVEDTAPDRDRTR